MTERLDPTTAIEKLAAARQRWLGSVAMSAESIAAMMEIDELLDQVNINEVILRDE
jgi:hypothetical protein